MADKQNDKLRLLLRRFQMPTPPPDFTGEVMKEIESMADDRVHANSRLAELLKKSISPEPSAGFTFKVINRVHQQHRVSYPPIISMKVWISIAAFVVFCLIISIFNEPGGSTQKALYFSIPVGDFLTGKLVDQLFYFVVVAFPVMPLLAIDYYFRKKLRRGH